MSLVIMKLAIEAATTTSVVPEATRFFAFSTNEVAGGDTLTIDTAEFFDDKGSTPAALPSLNSANSTAKLYINGVLQMDGIYTYKPGSSGAGGVVITVPETGSILAASPIVIEVINYTPTSTTDVAT